MKHKGSASGLMMGFIDAAHIEQFNAGTEIGRNRHEVALYVWDGYFPSVHANDGDTNLHSDWKFDTEQNDRFQLLFDFESRNCMAYYNHNGIIHELGLLTKKLPKRIYLAASVYLMNSSFQTTLFEMK